MLPIILAIFFASSDVKLSQAVSCREVDCAPGFRCRNGRCKQIPNFCVTDNDCTFKPKKTRCRNNKCVNAKGSECLTDIPVCCQGTTFNNQCEAKKNGETNCFEGECIFCGGFAGFLCPNDKECVDTPNDGCDPLNGGADCGGYCAECVPSKSVCPAVEKPVCCDGTQFTNQCEADNQCATNCVKGSCQPPGCVPEDVSFIADPETCKVIKFICVTGTKPWFDTNCGCGCQQDPSQCSDILAPVCCEGNTYDNKCEAGVAGAVNCFNGQCEFCGGISGIQCTNTADSCEDVPNDGCDPLNGGADCGGYCKPCVPSITPCFAIFDPVCCDGREYGNDCSARAQCAQNCVKGSCVCPDVVDEVCCDGITFDNKCEAARRGAQNCFPGACESCGGLKGIICSSGRECVDVPNDGCDPSLGDAHCLGYCASCTPSVGVCIQVYDHVCCNGKTYSNSCHAFMDCARNCEKGECCGTIAGISCPAGKQCNDIPNDGCDPPLCTDWLGTCH